MKKKTVKAKPQTTIRRKKPMGRLHPELHKLKGAIEAGELAHIETHLELPFFLRLRKMEYEAIVCAATAHLLEIPPKVVRDALDWQKDIETEAAECAGKYGPGLIRVHWQYANNAFQNAHLRHVCTWADGDEGFVPNAEAVPNASIK